MFDCMLHICIIAFNIIIVIFMNRLGHLTIPFSSERIPLPFLSCFQVRKLTKNLKEILKNLKEMWEEV